MKKPIQIELRWRIVRGGVRLHARTRHGRWLAAKRFYFAATAGTFTEYALTEGGPRAFLRLPDESFDSIEIRAFVERGSSPSDQDEAVLQIRVPAREWR